MTHNIEWIAARFPSWFGSLHRIVTFSTWTVFKKCALSHKYMFKLDSQEMDGSIFIRFPILGSIKKEMPFILFFRFSMTWTRIYRCIVCFFPLSLPLVLFVFSFNSNNDFCISYTYIFVIRLGKKWNNMKRKQWTFATTMSQNVDQIE